MKRFEVMLDFLKNSSVIEIEEVIPEDKMNYGLIKVYYPENGKKYNLFFNGDILEHFGEESEDIEDYGEVEGEL